MQAQVEHETSCCENTNMLWLLDFLLSYMSRKGLKAKEIVLLVQKKKHFVKPITFIDLQQNRFLSVRLVNNKFRKFKFGSVGC